MGWREIGCFFIRAKPCRQNVTMVVLQAYLAVCAVTVPAGVLSCVYFSARRAALDNQHEPSRVVRTRHMSDEILWGGIVGVTAGVCWPVVVPVLLSEWRRENRRDH